MILNVQFSEETSFPVSEGVTQPNAVLCFGIELLSAQLILFLEMPTFFLSPISLNSIESLVEVPNLPQVYDFRSFLILYELPQPSFHHSRLTLAKKPAQL